MVKAQDQGCRAVGDGRTVEKVDGIGNHRRALPGFQRDGAAEHGVGIVHSIGVGVEAEWREVDVRDVMLVHVAAHHQGVERDERRAVRAFVVGVGSGGQRRGNRAAGGVGHLFHTTYGDQVDHAAGNGAHACLYGHAARSAGRLDRCCLEATPADVAGDERAQLGLVADARGQHVGDEQRLRPVDSGVGRCGLQRLGCQVAQTTIPPLTDGRLACAKDVYITHTALLHEHLQPDGNIARYSSQYLSDVDVRALP